MAVPSPLLEPQPDHLAGDIHVGFLTILEEESGILGGYLVTNHWGRPLEFRLSSAVRPNKMQQILYGDTLLRYICGDLIGKTLVEKANVPVQLIVTDREAVLALRLSVNLPVIWVASADAPIESALRVVRPAEHGRGPILCHPNHIVNDRDSARDRLAQVDSAVDVAEPFERIRAAIAEARKLGVGGRAAA